MGKIKKGINCSINGCPNPAIRSVNAGDAKKAKLDFNQGKLNRIYICEEHYKTVKKLLKKDKQTEKWRRGF